MISERIKYFLPDLIIDLARYIKSRFSIVGKGKTLSKNKKCKNVYLNESVNIFANGPSLSQEVQESLAGKKIIVMNDFYKSKLKDSFDIVACCYAEPKSSIAFDESNINNIINNTSAKTYWFDISLSSSNIFENKAYAYFIAPGFEPNLYIKDNIDLSKSTLSYNTTASMAIMVAIYMGFKNISLHGFDHDWLANPKHMKHFYSDSKDSTDHWDKFSYHEQIKIADRIWSIYKKINQISKKQNISIINKSKNTFLDIFEIDN